MFGRIVFMLFPKRREKYIGEIKVTKFKNMYKKVYLSLWINGLMPKPINSGILLVWIVNFIIQICGVLICSNTMYLDILKKDYSDATRQMTILFLIIMMLTKIANLIKHRSTLNSLLIRLDEDYEEAACTLGDDDMKIVKTYIAWGMWLQNLWMVLVFGSGTVFWWAAFIIMFYTAATGNFTKMMLFEAVLPIWDEYKFISPFFEVVFVYEMFLDLFVMFLYSGFDPIVPIFLMHVCAQLELVKRHLLDLFNKEKIRSEAEVKRKLCWIVQKLQRIYSFAVDVNNMSTSIFEIIFFVTPILTTSSAFQILSCVEKGEIPYEFTMFLISCAVHMFIPSFFGDMMIEKSLAISEAVYNCEWETYPNRDISLTLLIIMTRAQKPVQLYTMFKPISLMLFSEASQRTWTFFNLMLASFK